MTSLDVSVCFFYTQIYLVFMFNRNRLSTLFVSCLHTDTYVVVVIPNCEYIANRTDAVVTRIVYIDEILCVCKYYYFFQRSSNVKLVMIHRCVCLYKGYLYMFVLYSSICLH